MVRAASEAAEHSTAGLGGVVVYHVYVMELEPEAPSESRPAVYVGETGQTPEQRFAKHKAGGLTASPVVYRRGLRLRPDLWAGVGPFAKREEAEAAELTVARRLRSAGYDVHGGQGRTFSLA
jgi:hypothetical protein